MTTSSDLPIIIQGGMGVAVSSWRLARAVAQRGHLGVVSGTAIERVVACRLQEGDPNGDLRRVLARCPLPGLAERVIAAWFRPDGLPAPGVYRPVPLFSLEPSTELLELTIAAAFAEVALAKETGGQVGINLLEKIQLPTLPVLYGALLAGVDWVLMGAGIPREVPGHLDQLAAGQPTALKIAVEGSTAVRMEFTPAEFGVPDVVLRRPRFIAIVSSDVLAQSLARSGGVDGFVVEGPTAGGHNAPPRGGGTLDVNGEPVYGPRDQADLARMRAIGIPFWLAGGWSTGADLTAARQAGAQGVQVGTAFAFCAESGLRADLRAQVLASVADGSIDLFTDPRASPTGFPFKLVQLAGSEGGRPADIRQRRTCTLGYLRHAYAKPDGRVGWRCSAEPREHYQAKGGSADDCADRRCICNGLMASAGHAQATGHGDEVELPLITAGDELHALGRFLTGKADYTAGDVLDVLLSTGG